MKQAGITLKVGAEIYFPVDDLVEMINRFFYFAATEIHGGKLVMKYQYTVAVEVDAVISQFFLDVFHQGQPLGKRPFQEMFVDQGDIEVNKALYPVIDILLHQVR